MKKKTLKLLLNVAIFWIYCDIMPGVNVPYGPVGKLILGIIFGVIMNLTPFLIGFFKVPKMVIFKFLGGVVFTFAYLLTCSKFATSMINFGPSYVGSTDLILIKIPKLLVLNDITMVLAFSAVFLVICSIIVEKFYKR